MIRKLGKNYQVALPRKVVKNLHLNVDDYIDITIEDSKIIIEPQVIIPKDQAYFHTKEWQKDEKEADKDIKSGRTTKTKNIKELFEELDK